MMNISIYYGESVSCFLHGLTFKFLDMLYVPDRFQTYRAERTSPQLSNINFLKNAILVFYKMHFRSADKQMLNTLQISKHSLHAIV